jgi:hypothetical protein
MATLAPRQELRDVTACLFSPAASYSPSGGARLDSFFFFLGWGARLRHLSEGSCQQQAEDKFSVAKPSSSHKPSQGEHNLSFHPEE